MLSNASSWFIDLQGEDRAYHTCVSADEAFLRAFRSTSFRIRSREQLRREWHQSLEEGGKNNINGVASKSNFENSTSCSITETCGGARCGTRTSSTATDGSSRNPYTSPENLNKVQQVLLTSKDYYCPTATNDSTTDTDITNSSSTNNVNECIHNLLSNLIVFGPTASSGGTKAVSNSMRKLKFASTFLKDARHAFNIINAVLKDEDPALQFLDPLTTWPQWYDGNDGKALKGVTERKFILHVLALVDMHIRSSHRQWLRRDDAVTPAVANFSGTAAVDLQNNHDAGQQPMSLYDYLEEKKVKAPLVTSSNYELLEHFDVESGTQLAKLACKVSKRKKKNRKKEPRQQKPAMETSGEQVPLTHVNNNESESIECCSLSILASVHSNKENGESSVPLNDESPRTCSTASSNNPLAEVNISSKDPSLKTVKALNKSKKEEKVEDAEDSWTVVSKKISTGSFTQVKTKVKAVPRQPSYVSVVSSSSTNSAAANAVATVNNSSSSSYDSSVIPKSVSAKVVESSQETSNVQTKLPFSSIAAGVATATHISNVEASISSKQVASSSKEESRGSTEKNSKQKSRKTVIGTETDSSALPKKNHTQHNRTNISYNQRHSKNSSYSIHLTVRQAPTSPKNYHPQSWVSMQRQQSGGSNTNTDCNKKNRHSTLALPISDQSCRQQKAPAAFVLQRSATDESQPSVPMLLGIESNSASSSVSSSLDGPGVSMPRLRCQDKRKARRSAKITEEGYHLLNSCKKLSTDIDLFMERRSAALVCRRNERRLLLGALQVTIDSLYSPTNRRHRCHAEIYGSCATQLDLPSSDLDVVVRGIAMMPIDKSIVFSQSMNHHYYLPPHPNAAHVMRLAVELEKEPWAVHIKPIPTALVPVVKILADPSRLPGTSLGDGASSSPPYEVTQNSSSDAWPGEPATTVMNQWRGADALNGLMSVDITFEGPGHGGIGSTAFAARVVQDACNESNLPLEKTPLVQVFMVLKELLAQRRLNEPFSGGLSSYSLLMLVCAVMKDVKNLRKSLTFSDTRKHGGKDADETFSEESLDEASLNSLDNLRCDRGTEIFGASAFEVVKSDPELAKCSVSKDKDSVQVPSKKEASVNLGKGIAAKGGTATTTACSSDNGATEELATNSTAPSCSSSFFAQVGPGSNDILEVLCRGDHSPGKLLMHFLLFYGKLFDAKTTAIDVNSNGSPFVYRKPGGSMDPVTGMFSVDQIVIFDPLEGGERHNVARSCFAWYSVRQVFSQCYATLVQSIESYGSGTLDQTDTSPLLALLLSY